MENSTQKRNKDKNQEEQEHLPPQHQFFKFIRKEKYYKVNKEKIDKICYVSKLASFIAGPLLIVFGTLNSRVVYVSVSGSVVTLSQEGKEAPVDDATVAFGKFNKTVKTDAQGNFSEWFLFKKIEDLENFRVSAMNEKTKEDFGSEEVPFAKESSIEWWRLYSPLSTKIEKAPSSGRLDFNRYFFDEKEERLSSVY